MSYSTFLPPDAPPRTGRFYKPHTIEDLWKIEVDPPKRLIRPVLDNREEQLAQVAAAEDAKWQSRVEQAFQEYERIATYNLNQARWHSPIFKTRFDTVRYWLRTKLIAWKVII